MARYVGCKDADRVLIALVDVHGWAVEERKKHIVFRHPTEPERRRTLNRGTRSTGYEALKNLRAELKRCEREAQ